MKIEITTIVNMNTYQIVNDTDKKHFTLHVEWLESSFKVLLLNSTMPPLCGEMGSKDIDFFSSEFSKTCEDYLQETKDTFCGKNSEAQFSVKEKELEWKTSCWTLGKISLSPVMDIQVISEILQKILTSHQDIQEKLEILQEENKCLKEKESKLIDSMEEMIKLKITMEEDLYKKFLLLLNSKKEKIRELQAKLKETEPKQESIFDAPTDSEKSDDEDVKVSEEKKKSEKRKSLEKINPGNSRKTRRTYDEHDVKLSYDTSPKPSTSKGFTETESIFQQLEISNTKTVKSRISFLEEESDDELFC